MSTPRTLRPKAKALEIVRPDYNLKYLRFLVYGETGVGKTVLAASAADVSDLAPILFCDCDLGTMSIADRDIHVVSVKDMNDLLNVNRYIRANPGEYSTVIVDGLTALYYTILRDRLRTPGRSDKEDPYVPSLRDYLHGTFRLRLLLQAYKTAPINVIMTALVDEKIDEFTSARSIRPALSNKLAQEIGADFDIVGYLSVKIKQHKPTRLLQLEPFGNRGAKNRSTHKLPAVLEAPTMAKIYRGAILGELTDSEEEEVEELIEKLVK